MEMRLNNGRTIPAIGFGTFKTPDGQICVDSVKSALETGYTHIDTAAIYGNEDSVGKAIRESGIDRDKIFVTSKLWNTERGYDSTLRAFDKTLETLGFEYLDLYLIHWPANAKQFKDCDRINRDTWRAFEKLYSEGLVKSIGLSNFKPSHIGNILTEAKVVPAVNQIEYHPGFMQEDTVDFCRRHDILVEAWSPLGRGDLLETPEILSIAAVYGKTPAQIILRWVLQNGVLPLVKSVHQERIKENFGIFDFEISGKDMAVIDSLKGGRMFSDPDTCDF